MHSGLFLAGTCSSSRLRALVKLLSAALSSGLSVVSLVPSGCGACVCCEWEQGLETVFAAVRFGRGIPVPMDVLPSVPFGWLESCARCIPAGGGSGRFAVPEEVGPFPAWHYCCRSNTALRIAMPGRAVERYPLRSMFPPGIAGRSSGDGSGSAVSGRWQTLPLRDMAGGRFGGGPTSGPPIRETPNGTSRVLTWYPACPCMRRYLFLSFGGGIGTFRTVVRRFLVSKRGGHLTGRRGEIEFRSRRGEFVDVPLIGIEVAVGP